MANPIQSTKESIKGTTRLIGIIGFPVSHSLSPAMHNHAFSSFGLDYVYVPLPLQPDQLKAGVQALKTFGFTGANVTVPHKEKILRYLDEISPEAQLIGAVNTLLLRDGKIWGTTTDYTGFKEGFAESGGTLKNKSVALLGTGGSARTIAFGLLAEGEVSSLTLVGRDTLKLKKLRAELIRKLGKEPDLCTLSDYHSKSKSFDVIVHTTTIGMTPNVDSSLLEIADLHPHQTVYDIIYNPKETRLLRLARERGLKTINGLGMLVHQGMAAFQIWTGVKPQAQMFYTGIQKSLY